MLSCSFDNLWCQSDSYTLLLQMKGAPLKCPIWFMHHVLIIYCTLKSIYFAEIAFICDVGAIKLTDICSVRKG